MLRTLLGLGDHFVFLFYFFWQRPLTLVKPVVILRFQKLGMDAIRRPETRVFRKSRTSSWLSESLSVSVSLTRSLAHSCGMFKEMGLLQPEVLLKGALLASPGQDIRMELSLAQRLVPGGVGEASSGVRPAGRPHPTNLRGSENISPVLFSPLVLWRYS